MFTSRMLIIGLVVTGFAQAASPDFNRPLGPQPAVSEGAVKELSGKKVEDLSFRLGGFVVRVPDAAKIEERNQRGVGKEAVDFRELSQPIDKPSPEVRDHAQLVYEALPRQLARRNMAVTGDCQDPCISVALHYMERQASGVLEITVAAQLLYQGKEILWSRGDWTTKFGNVHILEDKATRVVVPIYLARKTVHEIAHALTVRFGIIVPPEPNPATVK